MKIRKIQLENVKSYVNETIEFNNGVNFISGINGAGKTTIIESIGYALFNTLPIKIDFFKRYGCNRGIITIEFEANDSRIYRVVRKFGTTNSWVIFDVENESELDLHGAKDIEAWLKESMEIPQEEKLGQLFNNVIGVNQGSFTAPFLGRDLERKQIFNDILKVESYRQAFEKMSKVTKYINEDIINPASTKKAVLEERIRDYDEINKNVEELKKLIQALKLELDTRKKELKQYTKDRDDLRLMKKNIETNENEIQLYENNIENQKKHIKRIEHDLKQAEKAVEKVAAASEGYNQYIAAQKELEQLENNRKIRDQLTRKQSKIAENIVKIETEVNEGKKNIEDENKEVIGQINENKSLINKNIQELNNASQLMNQTSDIRNKSKNLQELFFLCEKKLNSLTSINERIKDERTNLQKINNNIADLKVEIEAEEEIENKFKNICLTEKELQNNKIELEKLEAKLVELKENQQKTKDGLCPFLNAPCLNVEGDLTTYFQTKMAKLNREIKEKRSCIRDLEQEVKAKEDLQKALVTIEGNKKLLANAIRQKEESLECLTDYFSELLDMDLYLEINNILESYLDLSEEIEKLHKEFIDEEKITSLKALFKDFNQSIEQYSNSFAAPSDFEKFKLDDLKSLANTILEKANSFKDSSYHYYSILEKKITNEYENRLSVFQKLEQKQQMLQTEEKSLKLKLKKLQERTQQLEKRAERLNIYRQEKEEIQEQLKIYDHLDEKISEQQNLQKQNQEAYNEYIKYKKEAEQLANIKEELLQNNEQLLKNQEILNQLKEKNNNLKSKYDENLLEELETKVEELGKELVKEESNLQERENDLKENIEKLNKMKEAKKEIDDIEAKINKYNTIKDVLEYIRTVLNRAGEKVGAVYREFLAKEANRLYREVSKENVVLEWTDDYDIVLVDQINGRTRRRTFKQLSGGEQMTAALAIRLSLLKQLSNVRLGFFDEPTTNLDSQRRNNLAQVLPEITQGFDQIFVISHDDSFDSITENIIQITKDSGNGSILQGV